MKIKEAISLVNDMMPNQYTDKYKLRWLSSLDGIIFHEIIETHACPIVRHFHGYCDGDLEKELIVPHPYCDDIYNYYLQAQIAKENGEFAKYNQAATMYNNAYKTFQDYYNRTHLPLPPRSAFRF